MAFSRACRRDCAPALWKEAASAQSHTCSSSFPSSRVQSRGAKKAWLAVPLPPSHGTLQMSPWEQMLASGLGRNGEIDPPYREDSLFGDSQAILGSRGRPRSPSPSPLPCRASRWLRRFSDRFTGHTGGRRNSSHSDSEFNLIAPPSSELMPTATSSGGGGGGADEYAALLGGFACFPTSPVSLAAHPGESDLLHSRSMVSTRARPGRTTSLQGIGEDPAHLPQPQRTAHPTASYASHHPSPRINVRGGNTGVSSQGAPIQGGGAERNDDHPVGITTARHAFDPSRPRTLLRRLTTSSSISSRSSSHRHEGPTQEQGHRPGAAAATEEEEEEDEGAGGGGAPVLSSRFSDWSTAPSSRTPSPARSCGCRWTLWSSSSESLHAPPTSSSSSASPPQVRCDEHAAPPSGSPQQQ